jgi:hypothetical protein
MQAAVWKSPKIERFGTDIPETGVQSHKTVERIKNEKTDSDNSNTHPDLDDNVCHVGQCPGVGR